MSLYAKLIGVLALVIALGAACWKCYHAGYTNGTNAQLVIQEAAILKAKNEADQRLQARIEQNVKNDQQHQIDKARISATATSARNELDSLRNAITSAAGQGSDTTAPSRVNATREGELLGRCANELVQVAGSADQLAIKVTGLQDYVNGVIK